MSLAAPAGSVHAIARPWRRRVLWFVGLLAVGVTTLVAVWFYRSWSDDANVAAAIAETDRLDPRWRWADMVADRPALADDQNGALIVERVMRLNGGPFVDIPDEPLKDENGVPAEPLTPEQMQTLRKPLVKAWASVVEARTLRGHPTGRMRIRYDPDFISTSLGPVQDARTVSVLLFLDAVLRAEEGAADGAMESCHAVLNAGRSVGDEPFMIVVLVRRVCINFMLDALERTLAQGQPSEPRLVEMQAALQRELAEPTLLRALRGERAGRFELLQRLCNGQLRRSQVAASVGLRQPELVRLFGDYVPARARYDRAAFLRRRNALVEAAKLPIEKQAPAFDSFLAENAWIDDGIEMLPLSWFQNALTEHVRAQANLRCAIVALAAERYRQRHDAWPVSLDQLVEAGLIKSVPIDPYGGKALRCARTPSGLAVYSVGPDGRDDGGNVQRRFTSGQGQRHIPPTGTDQGFRLWDADRRAKPRDER